VTEPMLSSYRKYSIITANFGKQQNIIDKTVVKRGQISQHWRTAVKPSTSSVSSYCSIPNWWQSLQPEHELELK